MIAQLSGAVARVAATYVVLDVQGVGYKVFVPLSVLERLPPQGERVSLVTHTLVREDELSLFGFTGEDELRLFELLLSVSGIGPKAALVLLSALSAEGLAQAVVGEDVRTLTRVPGIGAKTAQRLVLELKDKLEALGLVGQVGRRPTGAPPKKPDAAAEVVGDVVSALVNIGYNKPEASRAAEGALEEMVKAGGAAPDVTTLFRAAMNRLTGR